MASLTPQGEPQSSSHHKHCEKWIDPVARSAPLMYLRSGVQRRGLALGTRACPLAQRWQVLR